LAGWGEGWDKQNSITDIKAYFEAGDPPLKEKEFLEFWKSLSEEEKNEYRKADLSQG
jgi:hypothetical protein